MRILPVGVDDRSKMDLEQEYHDDHYSWGFPALPLNLPDAIIHIAEFSIFKAFRVVLNHRAFALDLQLEHVFLNTCNEECEVEV